MSEPFKYDRFEQYEKLKDAGYQEDFLNELRNNWHPKENGKYFIRITDSAELDTAPEDGVFIDCTHFETADELTNIHKFFEGFMYEISDVHTGKQIGAGIIDFSAFEEMEEYTGDKWEINYELLKGPSNELADNSAKVSFNYENLKSAGIPEETINDIKKYWQPKETGKYVMRISTGEERWRSPKPEEFIVDAYFDNAEDLTIIHRFFEGQTYIMKDVQRDMLIGLGTIDYSPFKAISSYTREPWVVNMDLLKKPLDELYTDGISDRRKAELFSELLNYVCETVNDEEEIANVLRKLGFSDKEIQLEGLLTKHPEYLSTDDRYIAGFPKSFVYFDDYTDGVPLKAKEGERFNLGMVKNFDLAYYISEENGDIIRTDENIGIEPDVYTTDNDFVISGGWAINNLFYIYDSIEGIEEPEKILMLSGKNLYISDEMKKELDSIKNGYSEKHKNPSLHSLISSAQEQSNRLRDKSFEGPEKER